MPCWAHRSFYLEIGEAFLMPSCCYIIYSIKIDRYYVGHTDDFINRIEMHNTGFSPYTSKANDWRLFLLIPCKDKSEAARVERHIKAMKSRSYIENLGRHPEMVAKLIERFAHS